jgi:hypothetical protein
VRMVRRRGRPRVRSARRERGSPSRRSKGRTEGTVGCGRMVYKLGWGVLCLCSSLQRIMIPASVQCRDVREMIVRFPSLQHPGRRRGRHPT